MHGFFEPLKAWMLETSRYIDINPMSSSPQYFRKDLIADSLRLSVDGELPFVFFNHIKNS
jgi:hypothetical protein